MLTHLLECRRRMLQICVCFIVLFVACFTFAPTLFQVVALPLLQVLPVNATLIATQITTPLMTPIKLAADIALLGTAPFALLHVWLFASPGLYRQERKPFLWAMAISLVLFLLGILFCFYLVLPYMFAFFARAVPAGVRLMPDMGYAVDFITRMTLIFGLCFQVPLVCCVLVHFKVVNITLLTLIRPYVIVAAFIIGMLLTPPDVLSQIMLAAPLCVLYEAGIILARCTSLRSSIAQPNDLLV